MASCILLVHVESIVSCYELGAAQMGWTARSAQQSPRIESSWCLQKAFPLRRHSMPLGMSQTYLAELLPEFDWVGG